MQMFPKPQSTLSDSSLSLFSRTINSALRIAVCLVASCLYAHRVAVGGLNHAGILYDPEYAIVQLPSPCQDGFWCHTL
jgi:hypothetical protein